MSSPDAPTHGKTTQDKLVYMANQIGMFFKSQDQATAAEKIADHIAKFWDPRMRAAILVHLDAGGAGLDPASREAIEMLPRAPSPNASAR